MASDLVLVDSVIWMDHAKKASLRLLALQQQNRVAVHEDVIAEYALGSIGKGLLREKRLDLLRAADRIFQHVSHTEQIDAIEKLGIGGTKVNFVDLQILITALTHRIVVWSRDRKLCNACRTLNVKLF